MTGRGYYLLRVTVSADTGTVWEKLTRGQTRIGFKSFFENYIHINIIQ